MNSLEEWCFWNIICSFGSLLSYVFILVHMEVGKMKTNRNNVKPRSEDRNDQQRNVKLEASCFAATLGGFVMFIIVYVRQSVLNH